LARLTRNLVEHARRATSEINELATEISALAERLAPSLLAIRSKASGDNGREVLCAARSSKESYLWRLEETLGPVLSTPLAGIPGFRQMGSQVGRWPR
jgi:hypothetical protein